MYKAGFLGCGNMGGALAAATAKAVGAEKIAVFDTDKTKMTDFCEKKGTAGVSRSELLSESEFIFLGVKPQMLGVVFDEIREDLKCALKSAENGEAEQPVLVSMAAGVAIASLKERLGLNIPVIRIMPNMPVCVGKGVVLFSCDGVSDEKKSEFLKLSAMWGMTDEINEAKIDAASCVSGCGPAFAYMFIEALADGAVSCGLSRNKAIEYAASTLAGAAETVLLTGENPEKLKDDVCSPAGSTIEGVFALEEGSFRKTAAQAVRAAYKKTSELGK